MTSSPSAPPIVSGGGAAGELLRGRDWSGSVLGPTESWPDALKAIVRMMLATRQATCLFWGPELINLYNDGFIPLLGEKHPQAMGQPARECWSDAWPVVGGLLTNVVEHGEAVLFQEMVIPIVRGGHLQDAWWNYSYSPVFDDQGGIAGVLVVATETTSEVNARRGLEAAHREADLARQELQSLFLQAPLPMALLKGPEQVFSLVNQPYRALVNRDVQGKKLSEVFTDQEVGYYVPFIDGVYRTGEPMALQAAPLRLTEHGTVRDRFIDVGFHPFRTASGEITGVLAIIHDVTQQVLARRRESELRQMAEAASVAKDEFLAMVSHELRNPLNAILGWSRILSSVTREPRQIDKGLEIIERNAKAQAKLIDAILDVSRITSGKVKLELGRVRLADVIQGAVDSIRPTADAKQIQLAPSVDQAELDLIADEDKLHQVVWNLLSNAVKFTEPGGDVSITVAKKGSTVAIRVADTGRGIPASLLPFVFDRFRQGDASTTKHHAGLGLGLAIVRSLVELHGGTVSAHSAGEGRGAEFEVVLPLRGAESAPQPAAPVSGEAGSAAPSHPGPISLAGARVLVVDDEQDARELVSTVLRQAGADVTAVGSVPEALAVLAASPVSVVVSDIGMPSEDGYRLVQRIRTEAPAAVRDVPALALTAYARPEERRRAVNAGFEAHVAKPFEPQMLVREVAALVGKHRPS